MPDVRPTRSPGVDWVDIDGDLLLYDGRHLRLMASAAALIWRAIDGCRSLSELVTDVAAGDPVVERDVRLFLTELSDQELILTPQVDDVARYLVAEHVARVDDGPQSLLLDLRTGQRWVLSPTGSQTLHLLNADPDPRTVLAGLHRTYPDSPASIETDLARLLDELVTVGALVRHL